MIRCYRRALAYPEPHNYPPIIMTLLDTINIYITFPPKAITGSVVFLKMWFKQIGLRQFPLVYGLRVRGCNRKWLLICVIDHLMVINRGGRSNFLMPVTFRILMSWIECLIGKRPAKRASSVTCHHVKG